MSTFPVVFDDGTRAMVPHENLQNALRDGGKLAQHMLFDDGTRALVPLERVHAAMKDGGSIIGETGPSTPAPVNMQEHDLLGPIDENAFGTRVGKRIEGNIAGPVEEVLKVSKPGYVPSAEDKAQQDATRKQVFPWGTGGVKGTLGPITYGPRMAYDMAKGWVEDPATLVGDVATAYIAHQASGGGGQIIPEDRAPVPGKSWIRRKPLVAPAAPPEAALSPEHAEMTAKLDKANAPYVKQLAADELARQQSTAAQGIMQGTQQLHEQVRGGLNQRWDQLRERMQGTEVPTQPITSAIERSQQMLAGVPDDLKIFKEITHAIESGSVEETAGRVTEAGMAPAEAGGLPFDAARVQASALGEKWASASGNLRRALRNVYDAYNQQLQGVADVAGTGREYQALREDWHQYVDDWQGKGPLAKVRNAPHPDYIITTATRTPSALLQQQLQRYRGGGAIAEQIANMREAARQAKVPPLKPVEPPEPAVAKPGFFRSHAPRWAGKIAGAKLGGWKGAVIGGEVGDMLGKKMFPPEAPSLAIPRTPEQYMRTILEAKEGLRTPGNADTMIKRGGGSVQVKMFVTKADEATLRNLGYPQAAINKMKPAQVQDIIENTRRYPSRRLQVPEEPTQ
jgi:hypothetical protein